MARHAGSPPRAWGQLVVGSGDPDHRRFTPTCVGTTLIIADAAVSIDGSPPRAWGQRVRQRSCELRLPVHPHVRGDNCYRRPAVAAIDRFTPTCVGTTSSAGSQTACCTVHPHVRGDNSHVDRQCSCHGSPPRAWGQRSQRCAGHRCRRFTPTCVGTTSFDAVDVSVELGSPPRAWGQHRDGVSRA